MTAILRQIVLDTETTGLEPKQGHRIIEIGCVEIINRRTTDRHFHHYIQPDRKIDEDAEKVHGITDEFLKDKPRFSDIVAEFIRFIKGAEVIIHNADFDVRFINHELSLLKQAWQPFEHYCRVLDTLALARKRHPGQKNSLDALCKRYTVDNTQRDLHGALLDAEILANVYLAMTGGQVTLLNSRENAAKAYQKNGSIKHKFNIGRSPLKIILPTDEENIAHKQRLSTIHEISAGKCIWLNIGDEL
jgi:DNA polymerase-3 subunit epsilon